MFNCSLAYMMKIGTDLLKNLYPVDFICCRLHTSSKPSTNSCVDVGIQCPCLYSHNCAMLKPTSSNRARLRKRTSTLQSAHTSLEWALYKVPHMSAKAHGRKEPWCLCSGDMCFLSVFLNCIAVVRLQTEIDLTCLHIFFRSIIDYDNGIHMPVKWQGTKYTASYNRVIDIFSVFRNNFSIGRISGLSSNVCTVQYIKPYLQKPNHVLPNDSIFLSHYFKYHYWVVRNMFSVC